MKKKTSKISKKKNLMVLPYSNGNNFRWELISRKLPNSQKINPVKISQLNIKKPYRKSSN